MAGAMRLRGLRMVDEDHAVMEFVTEDGEVRTFGIEYELVDSRSGTWTYHVEEAFKPWVLLELAGWPGGIDYRTFTDMVLAFRSIATSEWASDDTMQELRELRRAELARDEERP
jgi:hypothetical protein